MLVWKTKRKKKGEIKRLPHLWHHVAKAEGTTSRLPHIRSTLATLFSIDNKTHSIHHPVQCKWLCSAQTTMHCYICEWWCTLDQQKGLIRHSVLPAEEVIDIMHTGIHIPLQYMGRGCPIAIKVPPKLSVAGGALVEWLQNSL